MSWFTPLWVVVEGALVGYNLLQAKKMYDEIQAIPEDMPIANKSMNHMDAAVTDAALGVGGTVVAVGICLICGWLPFWAAGALLALSVIHLGAWWFVKRAAVKHNAPKS